MKKIFVALLFMLFLFAALGFTTTALEKTEKTVVASTADIVTADAKNNVSKDFDSENKALAAALVVGITAASGAVAMGIAISKGVEGMARQPEASGKINSAMMLGLVFIETLIVYALIVAILIIFVL